jgi:hypothetical protein
MRRQMVKYLALHFTKHRLEINRGDGNPLQQPKPENRQATKQTTTQEKNRQQPST